MLRHMKSSFLGGAVVFPGGKIELADGAAAWAERSSPPHARARAFASGAVAAFDARAIAVAACRETLEEAAILPTDRLLPAAEVEALRAELLAATRVAPTAAEVLAGAKAALATPAVLATPDALDASAPPLFAAALARRGLSLDLGALGPWGRWVTPVAEARRFDARFFLLALPEGQEGLHDDYETTHSFWASPAAILDRFARGEVFLAPPTTRALELLAEAADLRAALALADAQVLDPICPVYVPDEPPFLALPGDPAHDVPDRRVLGPTRFVLRAGRFVSEEPPAHRSTDAPPPSEASRAPGETHISRRSP